MTDLLAQARTNDQPAPDHTVDALTTLAIELGTNRPDVTTVAVDLVNFAQDNRNALRSARRLLFERLQHRSDDLDATRGLRVVEEALRAVDTGSR